MKLLEEMNWPEIEARTRADPDRDPAGGCDGGAWPAHGPRPGRFRIARLIPDENGTKNHMSFTLKALRTTAEANAAFANAKEPSYKG
jgi:hypothetical protein